MVLIVGTGEKRRPKSIALLGCLSQGGKKRMPTMRYESV